MKKTSLQSVLIIIFALILAEACGKKETYADDSYLDRLPIITVYNDTVIVDIVHRSYGRTIILRDSLGSTLLVFHNDSLPELGVKKNGQTYYFDDTRPSDAEEDSPFVRQ